jgi:hypothetical protein
LVKIGRHQLLWEKLENLLPTLLVFTPANGQFSGKVKPISQGLLEIEPRQEPYDTLIVELASDWVIPFNSLRKECEINDK